MVSTVAAKLLASAMALLSFVQGAAAQYGYGDGMYGMYAYGSMSAYGSSYGSGYGEYGMTYGSGYGEYGMTSGTKLETTPGGGRRLLQDMGSSGEYGYGYGMASYGYGMASYGYDVASYGYGEPGYGSYGGASISGTYGMGTKLETTPDGGRRLLQDMGSAGYGSYSYGYGEASYGYGEASYGYGEASYGYGKY